MPRRDDSDSLDLPGLRADTRAERLGTTGSRPAVTPPRPAGGGSDGPGQRFLLVAALLLAFGAGTWAFLLQQSLATARDDIVQSQARIADLERRLSSSDDSWNQSSAAMAARLKELLAEHAKLASEVDKLWASAWRRNQKEIADQVALLKKQETLLKTQGDALAALKKELGSDVAAASQKLGQLEQSVASRQKTLDDAVARFNKLAAEQADLAKRTRANEEWIESINAHRKQINQSLDSLRRSVDAISRPAPAAATQLR